MSFISTTRDNRAALTLVAMGIALALYPGLGIAASSGEDTIVVDGSADSSAANDQQDYSVKSTTAGTKMQMVQRDIPQSVSIVNEQRMQDQQLQTLGDVMNNTLGITSSQADSGEPTAKSCGVAVK